MPRERASGFVAAEEAKLSRQRRRVSSNGEHVSIEPGEVITAAVGSREREDFLIASNLALMRGSVDIELGSWRDSRRGISPCRQALEIGVEEAAVGSPLVERGADYTYSRQALEIGLKKLQWAPLGRERCRLHIQVRRRRFGERRR